MPEISRFYGIIIQMFFMDHNPPHFHITYGDYKAVITIDEETVEGNMPARALKLVFEWMEIHRNELMENWNLVQNGKIPNKIEPLKYNATSLIWIKNAKYISEYIIEFEFNTNEIGKINLEKYLDKGIFLALKNIEEFKKFKLNSWTIEWENGADFSPEFLYSLINSKELSYS